MDVTLESGSTSVGELYTRLYLKLYRVLGVSTNQRLRMRTKGTCARISGDAIACWAPPLWWSSPDPWPCWLPPYYIIQFRPSRRCNLFKNTWRAGPVESLTQPTAGTASIPATGSLARLGNTSPPPACLSTGLLWWWSHVAQRKSSGRLATTTDPSARANPATATTQLKNVPPFNSWNPQKHD